MPSFCVVSNCELKYTHSENVSFHKFPLHDESLLQKWIKFTDRGTEWKPSRWSSICSRHFLNSDFRELLSRKCLKKNAVPSLVTKNNISYETYHIPDQSSTANSQYGDEDLIDCNNDHKGTEPITTDQTEKNREICCRLCGAHIEASVRISIDDPDVGEMLRKCLPSISVLRNNIDHFNLICKHCESHLRGYSDFVDKVLTYQRDLAANNAETSLEDMIRIESHANNSSSSGPTSNSALFIKQEPINVKQEILDNSNKKPQETLRPSFVSSISAALYHPSTSASDQRINVVEQSLIQWPRTSANTFCQLCERFFINTAEMKSHECNGSKAPNTDRVETLNVASNNNNNCEIMEIITLNNPISFIDLAEDECVATAVCKKEIVIDGERRERVDIEHAYAKRSTIPIANASNTCKLKQEIEMNYDFETNDDILFDAAANNDNTNIPTQITDDSSAPQDIFVCSKCGQEFNTIHLLTDHANQMHSLKNRICVVCSAEFKSTYEYLLHKNKVHVSGHRCQQCKRKFNTRLALKNHERHSCSIDSMDYYYSCRYCSQFMRNRLKMKEHLRICERNPKKIEKEPVPSNPTCNGNAPNQPYNCPRCHRSFRKKINFKRHTGQCGLKLSTTNSNENEAKVHCVEDSDTHLTPVTNNAKADDGEHDPANELNAIIAGTPPSSAKCTNNNNNIGGPSGGKYVCEVCSKPFHAYANLKQHKTTHENEKKFVCVLCPKKFKRISGLNQHVRGFHYKIKPFSCPICSYTYALKGDMLRCRHSSLKKEPSTVNNLH